MFLLVPQIVVIFTTYFHLSLEFPVFPGHRILVNPTIEMIVNSSPLMTGHILTRVNNGNVISEALTTGLALFLDCRGSHFL